MAEKAKPIEKTPETAETAQPAQPAENAQEGQKKRGRGSTTPPPLFDDAKALASHVVAHRGATANDTTRMYTNEGFRSAGGLDNLPISTRLTMIASLSLSLATSAQSKNDDGKQATKALKIAKDYIEMAESDAKQAAKLAAYNILAATEDLPPFDPKKESVSDFIVRVTAKK